MKVESALEVLETVNGLYNFIILNGNDRKEILLLENSWNFGIKECLTKDIVVLAIHNSLFETPKEVFKIQKDKKVTLLPVNFHYLEDMNAVSGSPSLKVHDYLIKKYDLKLNDEEATLLVGFDLN